MKIDPDALSPQAFVRFDRIWKDSNMTRSQLLLYLGQRLHPQSAALNMAIAIRIHGDLNADVFAKAFRSCVDHIETLRLSVDVRDERFRMMPFRGRVEAMTRLDFSDRADPVGEARDWMMERARRPFDLSGQLFDAVLIRLGSREHVWCLNQHHLITDAWSTGLIYRRLEEEYRRRLIDGIGPSEVLPSFQEVIDAERIDPGTGFRAARKYWEEFAALGIVPPSLYGSARRADRTDSVRVVRTLSEGEVARLRVLASHPAFAALTPQASLFGVIATLLQAWQYRASGQSRLALGALNHGRATVAQRRIVGSFVETFPFWIDVVGSDSFLDLGKKVRLASIAFLRGAHPGSCPPELHRTFNVTLNYVTASLGDFDGLKSEFEWLDPGHVNAGHHLSLAVHDLGVSGSFVFQFDFNSDTFTEVQRDRALSHFFALFKTMLDTPEMAIDSVDVLDAEERRSVTWDAEPIAEPSGQPRSLFREFERQCALRPDKIALSGPHSCSEIGCDMTYAELNVLATRVARGLRARGACAGDRVALILEPSLDWIVGMLGVLKMEGVYFPLSIDDPPVRLEGALRKTSTCFAIVQPGIGEALSDVEGKYTIDELLSSSSEPAPQAMDSTSERADFCYLIGTSGSTGEPKYICGSQSALLNLLDQFEALAPLPDDAQVAWWTSPTFDVSLYEVWHALSRGRRLHVVPVEVRPDIECALRFLADRGIHSAFVPAFMLNRLVEGVHAGSFDLSAMRRLLVGVEPIQESLLASVSRHLPDLNLINGYGPAEATVCCSLYPVSSQKDLERIAPIGRPVKGMSTRILNGAGKPVPFGVPGELHVAGVGLALGYLGEKGGIDAGFGGRAMRSVNGTTWYRTGDLVRLLPGALMQFVGRVDAQIKIRGHRIEPSEVASTIESHPLVSRAHVMGWPREKPRAMVAYVSQMTDGGEKVTADDLRRYILTRLPRFMLPTKFLFLDALPLTTNGKIDTVSLPSVADLRPLPGSVSSGRARLDYESETEETLAEIWAKTLGVPSVGRKDNFIELGGDSIVAIQIVSRALQAGLEGLAPGHLFTHQTVGELSRLCSTHLGDGSQDLCRGPYPLAPSQASFLEQEVADPNRWANSVVVSLPDGNEPGDVEWAFSELLTHHDALRTAFIREESGWRAEILETAPEPHLVLRKGHERGAPDMEERLLDSLDLASGRLVALGLETLGNGARSLWIVVHHLVIDAASWSTLLGDLSLLLRGRSQGGQGRLPVKTNSFQQWATWVATYRVSEVPSRYWGRHVEDTVAKIPRDFVGDHNVVGDAEIARSELSVSCTERLFQLGSAAGPSESRDLMLAAVVAGLSEWMNERRLLIELEGHGREALESNLNTSRTIGWFTSFYPLLLDCQASGDFDAARAAVKAGFKELPHRGVSYGIARFGAANPELGKALRRGVEPEILFNFFGRTGVSAPEFELKQELRLLSAPVNRRRRLLEFNAFVVKGRQRLELGFSRRVHDPGAMRRLVEDCVARLRRALEGGAGSPPSVSNFPHANLDERRLGKVAAALKKIQPMG